MRFFFVHTCGGVFEKGGREMLMGLGQLLSYLGGLGGGISPSTLNFHTHTLGQSQSR